MKAEKEYAIEHTLQATVVRKVGGMLVGDTYIKCKQNPELWHKSGFTLTPARRGMDIKCYFFCPVCGNALSVTAHTLKGMSEHRCQNES